MTWEAFTRDGDATRSGAMELLGGSDFLTRFNAVGTWTAEALWSDDLWDRIQPGGGLVMRRSGHLLCNGPIVEYGYDVQLNDDTGLYETTIILEGVTDEIVLADRIVYPDPARSGTTQDTVSHWRMTAPAEDVMCALVEQQAGPGALPERRTPGLTIAPSQGRGQVVSAAIRYGGPNLLAELQGIARTAGLGFRVAATADGGRRFEVYEPSNKAGSVRYGTEMGNIADQKYRSGAPKRTYSLYGGGGQLQSRLQRDYQTTDPAYLEWRRRIEEYGDGRDTTEPQDLINRATESVTEAPPVQSYSFTPLDTDNARLIEHVQVGDKVTVYAGPPGGKRVSTFVDLVREIRGELDDDGTDTLRAAVGSEGATTGEPLPSMELLLQIRADLQALKGSA